MKFELETIEKIKSKEINKRISLKEFLGQNIRIGQVDNKGQVVEYKHGLVIDATDKLIVVGYKHYNESFNIGNILASTTVSVEVKVEKEWVRLKEVI